MKTRGGDRKPPAISPGDSTWKNEGKMERKFGFSAVRYERRDVCGWRTKIPVPSGSRDSCRRERRDGGRGDGNEIYREEDKTGDAWKVSRCMPIAKRSRYWRRDNVPDNAH